MDIYSRKLPTIRQLQYFLAICEEYSFRKAANKLNISQPPLSNQIKELEEKLEVRLFLRNTQKVMLTKEGELFRLKATSLLQELTLISNLFNETTTDKILLGMTKILCFDFIPKFKKFLNQFSTFVDVYKNQYTSKELLTELQRNNVNAIFISEYYNENIINEKYLLVHQEPMILVLPETHPASHDDYVDLNDVTHLPLFWFARYLQPVFYDQCEKVFNKLLCPVEKITELSDTLSMLLDVSLGNSIMLLPQSMIHANIQGVVYKRLHSYYEKQLTINIFLVWKDDNKLINNIVDYFRLNK